MFCLFAVQAEEKKRQEEEELLSKKLHEEQALHEAQLKEVCLLNLRMKTYSITIFEVCWLTHLFCLFACLLPGSTIVSNGPPSVGAWVRMYSSRFQSPVSTS